MILGVISDTHGNSVLMLAVAAGLADRLGVREFIHLGDDYRDAVTLEGAGYVVHKVPGLWCAEYQDSRTPKRRMDRIDGFEVAYAHADKDLRAPERGAQIILTGHTHTANLVMVGNTLYLNPGHLKGETSRDYRASYGLLTFSPEGVAATIHDAATDEVRVQQFLSRG